MTCRILFGVGKRNIRPALGKRSGEALPMWESTCVGRGTPDSGLPSDLDCLWPFNAVFRNHLCNAAIQNGRMCSHLLL